MFFRSPRICEILYSEKKAYPNFMKESLHLLINEIKLSFLLPLSVFFFSLPLFFSTLTFSLSPLLAFVCFFLVREKGRLIGGDRK